ncbi:MauE/DoxX family redox-associated membrane protein [Blastococcus sp. TF02A-30]|uniref:MauE/DoxX family redox-associated membrane protein n=1 Tax=Blastococcus sp. TF02A-30 TaxID=2250580 RepID=UPI000DE93C7A|nr:MauE/DoxX family redox-associated membrane protein [Blastococcus sp. TF02A-30]RBY84932.1 DoxX family protein [Blastococcus sp. TF02A-30]
MGSARAGDIPAVAPWAATAGRLLLGGVLVVAGAIKIPDPAAAVRAVRAYQLLPEPIVGPVAFGLPVVEIAVGLALLAGLFVRAAAMASAALLIVFMVGVASAWARGLQIDCGCFGGGGQVAAADTAYGTELLRDLGLLVVAVLLARWPTSRLALGSASRPSTFPDGDPPPASLALEKTHAR